MKKMWGLMTHLSFNQWLPLKDKTEHNEQFWEEIISYSSEHGINTILLDVGDGVKYESHPEISLPDAWDAAKVKKELARLKELGIDVIPKVDFSTGHCFWMKEYRAMTSSKPYYEFAKDIIFELYEIFGQPEYIHIGMDEENEKFSSLSDLVVYRKGDLLINDLKYLIDTVNKTGAKPIIWHDPMIVNPDGFFESISPDEVLIMPWWYRAIIDGKYTLLSEWRKRDLGEVNREAVGLCDDAGVEYVEDLPIVQKEINEFKEIVLPGLAKGYKYIPVGSVWADVDTNHLQLAEFFDPQFDNENILGYFTAPWLPNDMELMPRFTLSVDQLEELRKTYYNK